MSTRREVLFWVICFIFLLWDLLASFKIISVEWVLVIILNQFLSGILPTIFVIGFGFKFIRLRKKGEQIDIVTLLFPWVYLMWYFIPIIMSYVLFVKNASQGLGLPSPASFSSNPFIIPFHNYGVIILFLVAVIALFRHLLAQR